MAKRLKDRAFKSKKAFLSYMSKALTYEMRDAVVCSGASFKIKANYSEAEKAELIEEAYLREIEYSLQTSPEWHLKKKLAATLIRSKAYHLLQAYKTIKIKGSRALMYLTKPIELSQMDKQIILNQVKATQQTLDDNGDIVFIENLEFIYLQSDHKNSTIARDQNKSFENINNEDISEYLANIEDEQVIAKLPIWQRLRKSFMGYAVNKQNAIGVDRSWFSKLTMSEEKDQKQSSDDYENKQNIPILILKAENSFVRNWIDSNYLFKLESIAKGLGYKLILQD